MPDTTPDPLHAELSRLHDHATTGMLCAAWWWLAKELQQIITLQPFAMLSSKRTFCNTSLLLWWSPLQPLQDQRDALLGRTFGLAALIRSGLIAAVPAEGAVDGDSGSGPSIVQAATAAVAEQLAGLLQRKSFLRESAAAALVELLQVLDEQQMAGVLQRAPKTASLLKAAPSHATPESLFLALRLWHALPAQQLQQCELLPDLQHGQAPPSQAFWEQPGSVKRKSVAGAAAAVFSPEQVEVMAPALLLSTASHPRLHPVWGCLFALLLPGFVPVKVRTCLCTRLPVLSISTSCFL